MTKVEFVYESGFVYYANVRDAGGEYVPLAEYQELSMKVDKLETLILRVIKVGEDLFSDPELSSNWHWKDYLMDLDKLVVDCQEVLK